MEKKLPIASSVKSKSDQKTSETDVIDVILMFC